MINNMGRTELFRRRFGNWCNEFIDIYPPTQLPSQYSIGSGDWQIEWPEA